MVWLIFEIFVSSTGIVLVIHLLIPLYVLSDVSKIKEKILNDLTSFREKYLKNERNGTEERLINQSQYEDTNWSFNAAKYFFVSWRVANLFREIPESELILGFSTPWPKRHFKSRKEMQLSGYYEDQALFRAISQICLIFLVSLLHTHELIQDVLFQLVNDSTLAYLMFLIVRLYLIHPLLPVLVVVLVVGFIYVMMRSASNSEIIRRLKLSSIQTEQSEKSSKTSRSILYNQTNRN